MKVLLIEDETTVVSLIQRGLSEEGISVSVALDGTTGHKMANEHHFDAIILDIMLPGINGIELCKLLRADKISTPILFLTALGSTENIVTGLNSGADDYLAKPFKITELVARIRALGRRFGSIMKDDAIITFSDLQVNTVSKTVTRQNKPILLTATEYRLLEFLIKNGNRVLSRMELLEQVWGIDFNLGTNVVDVYINYLRKKIDKDFEHKLLHTMVGMGYILKS